DVADHLVPPDMTFSFPRGTGWSDPYPPGDPAIARDPTILRKLAEFQAETWAVLKQDLDNLDGRITLGACALLSYHPAAGRALLRCPGRYDPELEIIASALPTRWIGPIPDWDNLSHVLRLARNWLIIEGERSSLAHIRDFHDPRVRVCEAMRTQWLTMRGESYMFRARDAVHELLSANAELLKGFVDPQLLYLLRHNYEILAAWIGGLSGTAQGADDIAALRQFCSSFSVSQALDMSCL